MAWRQIGDKPLSEPMLTWLTDAPGNCPEDNLKITKFHNIST